MRPRIVLAAAAALTVFVGSGAVAQPSPAPSADVQVVSPNTDALVRRLMKAMHFEAQIDTMLGAMMPIMMEQQARQHPNLGPADQKVILDTVREVMREKFTPKLIERAVPIYAATFSESELTQMVAFYESPVGQSIITKMPAMAPKIAEAARELIPEATGDMARAMCAKVNCLQPTPAPVPKVKSS
jgi:hypothetical protein